MLQEARSARFRVEGCDERVGKLALIPHVENNQV
jgi:hypothetical protein